MAKCKNCANLYNLSDENDVIVGKWCPKISDSPDVEAERECVHYKRMTQADRIRSFSDEELAEFIEQVSTDSMETIFFGTKEYEEVWDIKKLLCSGYSQKCSSKLRTHVEVGKLN